MSLFTVIPQGPFESKCRKQLSRSSCGWVLIRSGQFKITAAVRMPTGHSLCSGPAPGGQRSFTLARLYRLRSNPRPSPRPTLMSGARSAASPAPPSQTTNGALLDSASPLAVSGPAWPRSMPQLPYVASLSATAKLSARIWPAFDEYDLDSGCLRSDTELALRSRVPDGDDFADESISSSQKALSSMIEACAFSDFMASDQVEHRKAHLVLNRNPGAGAWLTSLPNSADTHLPPSLFNGQP